MSAYQERVRAQTLAWAQGRPYHNRVDDECCPDFSCCKPGMFEANGGKRWQYYHDKHGWAALMSAYSLEIEGLVRRKQELESEVERLHSAIDKSQCENERLQAENERMRAVLETIAGQATDKLQAMQAKAGMR